MDRQGRAKVVRAAIFDFDGTLFETTDAICTAFNGALMATGRPPIPVDAIRSLIGRPLVDMFRWEDPSAAEAVLVQRVAAYRRFFLPCCVAKSHPMPGALNCVRQLRRWGIRLGVATNRRRDGAVRMLRGHGLRRYFEVVVGLDDVTYSKPNPEAVLRVLRLLRVQPGEAVMVGDTPDDVAAGRAAGTLVVAVATGPWSAEQLRAAGADVVVPSLGELPGEIVRLSALKAGPVSEDRPGEITIPQRTAT